MDYNKKATLANNDAITMPAVAAIWHDPLDDLLGAAAGAALASSNANAAEDAGVDAGAAVNRKPRSSKDLGLLEAPAASTIKVVKPFSSYAVRVLYAPAEAEAGDETAGHKIENAGRDVGCGDKSIYEA